VKTNLLRIRRLKDLLASIGMRFSLILVSIIAFVMFIGLFLKSLPIIRDTRLGDLLFSSSWHPLNNKFGLFPFIVSTVEVTLLAMVISMPICLLSTIYLSEYAHRHFRDYARLFIDILAGIPSVIYGLCGVLVIVPFVSKIGELLGVETTGYTLLAGGIILAVMVVPFVISVSLEVLRMVPDQVRESAFALGATRWETVKYVVLPKAKRGLIAAMVLGFARAFGETMAVLMVVGNVAQVPSSLFDAAYPLPALIANNYGEVMSIPLYDSALMLAALVLLLIVAAFSITAHLALIKIGASGD
jgi:phosphate transport system permease protein